jgi:hypothetical protein
MKPENHKRIQCNRLRQTISLHADGSSRSPGGTDLRDDNPELLQVICP